MVSCCSVKLYCVLRVNCVFIGSQDSATDIQEQLHQADSPSVDGVFIYDLLLERIIGGTYIVSRIVLIVIGVVYLITAIVYILIRNVKKDCDCLKVIWLVDITYLMGGIMYYVGRNYRLVNIFIICATIEECDSYRTTQCFLLGTVFVFYRFIPFFISKYYQSNLAKEHQTTEAKLQLVPEWILAAESLTLLVEFDALYTVMINSFYTARSCYSAQDTAALGSLSAHVIAAWVLWAFFVLMYIFILYYTMNIQYCGICTINCSCVTSNYSVIVPLAAFGMYLLAHNFVPLGCSGANMFIVPIVLRFLVLIVVITSIVLLLVYRCLSKTRQEKLLPRALYQHLHPEPIQQNDLPLETVGTNDDKQSQEVVHFEDLPIVHLQTT